MVKTEFIFLFPSIQNKHKLTKNNLLLLSTFPFFAEDPSFIQLRKTGLCYSFHSKVNLTLS